MNTEYNTSATERGTIMSKQTKNSTRQAGGSAPLAMICGLLLAAVSSAWADDHADARFKGTGKADPIRIANVRRSDGPAAGQSTITFDLAWDHSWRAAWEVGAEQHGGKGALKLESWDAAWVFVKFRQRGDNSWSHAMLSANQAEHRTPAAAALAVGLTDDGKRGVGVFVYRAMTGHGPNDFKGVTLRWLHNAVDPAAVELKVFALEMVYVPQCAFWVGDGSTDHVAAQFSAGYSANPFRVESERALTLGGETAETLNNRDAAGTNPSWTDDFNSDLPRTLPAEFPKGYKAFYCMRHEITQQQYVDFLNTLSYAEQCERSHRQADAPPGSWGVLPTMAEVPPEIGRSGIKIAASGAAGRPEPVVIRRESFVASGTMVKPGRPAVYATDTPHVACNFISHIDGSAYASWAGLRPMTELEFEKACRGPLKPVPNEYAWGTGRIAGMDSKNGAYKLQDPGKPDEAVVWEGDDGPDATHGNAALWRIRVESKVEFAGPLRVGIFATPTSDRVSSGASYWEILDLSGNVAERTISVGIPAGRAFAGTHGDGGASPWKDAGFAVRGGGYPHGERSVLPELFRTSNRYFGAWPHHDGRGYAQGFRCVRTAPVAKSE